MLELLGVLRDVRHPHLEPLTSFRADRGGITLQYGQPDVCQAHCDGVPGALAAVHHAGLWVGDVLGHIGFDDAGRVVLTAVGSDWQLADPFAGHPSVTGFDLRIGWRQEGDLLTMADLAGRLVNCSSAA